MITFTVAQFAYLGLIWLIFGTRAFTFHVIISALNILMFEAINYLEHYGLER